MTLRRLKVLVFDSQLYWLSIDVHQSYRRRLSRSHTMDTNGGDTAAAATGDTRQYPQPPMIIVETVKDLKLVLANELPPTVIGGCCVGGGAVGGQQQQAFDIYLEDIQLMDDQTVRLFQDNDFIEVRHRLMPTGGGGGCGGGGGGQQQTHRQHLKRLVATRKLAAAKTSAAAASVTTVNKKTAALIAANGSSDRSSQQQSMLSSATTAEAIDDQCCDSGGGGGGRCCQSDNSLTSVAERTTIAANQQQQQQQQSSETAYSVEIQLTKHLLTDKLTMGLSVTATTTTSSSAAAAAKPTETTKVSSITTTTTTSTAGNFAKPVVLAATAGKPQRLAKTPITVTTTTTTTTGLPKKLVNDSMKNSSINIINLKPESSSLANTTSNVTAPLPPASSLPPSLPPPPPLPALPTKRLLANTTINTTNHRIPVPSPLARGQWVCCLCDDILGNWKSVATHHKPYRCEAYEYGRREIVGQFGVGGSGGGGLVLVAERYY